MEFIDRLANLVRWKNVILIILACILGVRFGGGFVFPLVYVLLSTVLVLSGANAINNALDSNRDKPLKKNPVAMGAFTRRFALLFGFGLTVWGLIFSAMIELWFFIAALATSILLLLYNAYFKDKFLIGNLIVAGISGFLFIYIGMFFGLNEKFLFAAIFAFASHLTREIIKDIEDYDEDSSQNARTLAIVLGRPKTSIVVVILLIALSIGLPIPYLMGYMGLYYLLFALIGVIPLIITVIVMLRKTDFHRAQKLMKILMLLGLVALFIG